MGQNKKWEKWRNLIYILLWYFLSTSLSIYNKTLMSRDNKKFNFPILMSAMHSGTHMMISIFLKRFDKKTIVPIISRWDYLTKVVPCALAAAVEICCSNASLVLITLSFYTVIKSCTPIWVLMFSFVFKLETTIHKELIFVISTIVAGVILTVEGESRFNLIGFILVLVASIASGLRWNLTQFILKTNDGNHSPIATLYHLSPVMFVTMLSLSLLLENPFTQPIYFDTALHTIQSLCLMSFGGVIAFGMTLSELYLVKNTDTVTLSVAGVSKEIVVIGLSVFIYGDELTSKTYLGLLISIIGIIYYNYYKIMGSSTIKQD
ncbi:TPT-domain-containing protein [Backusella circina FSU 941]|nr:TPT-domain-containing protein [Backusella circina FSU 941]